ncbi:MAG TPA: hypothetical protein PK112_08685, partial [candidate division Zixibacteria bacterium]|nr:hypothetical protein [candidate division Zixibacteria bacterium]
SAVGKLPARIFTWIDGSIVGMYLLATMIAGIMVRKYVSRVDHFLVAGREMNVFLGIASLAATDMNRDARTGTIEDLVLLMRAVLGEYVPDPGMFLNRDAPAESPFAPPPPKDSRATLRLEENELAVEAEDSLVAARFVFRGRIVPHVYNTRLDVYSTYVNGQTRVLVYGFFSGASFGSGPFLYWEGSGRLTGFSLATVSGGRVEVRIRR